MSLLRHSTHDPIKVTIRRVALTLLVLFSFAMWMATSAAARIAVKNSSPERQALTLRQRIHYQRAIEEVYWRHTIWPKENPELKPSLDELLPLAAIEAKVRRYLSKSREVEAYLHAPLTAALLRSEAVRMQKQTKRPEMLRELWAALDNDPNVIAECLGRIALVDRVLSERTDKPARSPAFFANWTEPSLPETNGMVLRPGGSQPVLRANTAMLVPSADPPPDARYGHTAVWTGTEMIVWGGYQDRGIVFNTGARYDPAIDTWTLTSTVNAPSARYVHSAVWTGREMIVWGGATVPIDSRTGGRYDPVTDTWTPTSLVDAPTVRRDHTALWTGTEMLIWGGIDPAGSDVTYNSGSRYDPATDTWRATTMVGVPHERGSHSSVWTGTEMIIWGGIDMWTYLLVEGGARYDPAADTWAPISTVNAPQPRVLHSAVWTGREMLIFGGEWPQGGIYDPSSDTWRSMSGDNAPEPRSMQSAIWTGSEMIIWGGYYYAVYYHTGGRYNPVIDSWTPTNAIDAPRGRTTHSAIWTGREMIIWGGYAGFPPLNDGSRYDPASDSWTPTDTQKP